MSQTKAQLIDGKVATVEFSGGSASAPSIAFTGDTNTGIYSPGADQVAISTNGAGRLFVTSAGLVGIGTSAPQANLDCRGSILTTNGTTRWGLIGTDADGAYLGTAGINHPWIFKVGNGSADVERMRLTATGLGIGTSAPTAPLSFSSSVGQKIDLYSGAAGNEFGFGIEANELRVCSGTGSSIGFRTGGYSGSERARIDSSGRLLVGLSSGSDNNALLKVQGNVGGSTGSGWIDIRRGLSTPGSGSQLGILSFSDSSGNNYASIDCYTDAATGTNDYPGRLVFSVTADGASSPTEAVRISQNGITQFQNDIIPGADNAYQVGQSGKRWSVVFAGTGTINTSDANLKQDIEALEQAELNVAAAIKGLVKKFRFIDAVEAKGGAARIHIGVIAQEVEQAFIDEGLDPRRYAMFCEDTVEDGSKRLGIRYDELLAFVIAAL